MWFREYIEHRLLGINLFSHLLMHAKKFKYHHNWIPTNIHKKVCEQII